MIEHARRLRAYERYVPIWQRVLAFGLAAFEGVLIAMFATSSELREAVFAEPPAFVLGLAGLVGAAGFLWVAMLGGDLRGRHPDLLLDAEEKRTSEGDT